MQNLFLSFLLISCHSKWDSINVSDYLDRSFLLTGKMCLIHHILVGCHKKFGVKVDSPYLENLSHTQDFGSCKKLKAENCVGLSCNMFMKRIVIYFDRNWLHLVVRPIPVSRPVHSPVGESESVSFITGIACKRLFQQQLAVVVVVYFSYLQTFASCKLWSINTFADLVQCTTTCLGDGSFTAAGPRPWNISFSYFLHFTLFLYVYLFDWGCIA